MEIFIVIVLLVIGAMVWSRTKGAAEERRIAMATWEWDLSSGHDSVTWTFDFPSMTARYEAYGTDGPGAEVSETYHLRRRQDVWQVKPTAETHAAQIANVRAGNTFVSPKEQAARLRKLEAGPEWEDLPDGAAGIEPAFQRYTRQG